MDEFSWVHETQAMVRKSENEVFKSSQQEVSKKYVS